MPAKHANDTNDRRVLMRPDRRSRILDKRECRYSLAKSAQGVLSSGGADVE